MKTILIIDDEFSVVESLQEILEWEGYAVLSAGDGRSGLAELARAQPSLVLLDVMMPILDGFQVLRAMRAAPATRDTPVILMTAVPREGTSDEHLCDALLPKPFSIQQLLALIRQVL